MIGGDELLKTKTHFYINIKIDKENLIYVSPFKAFNPINYNYIPYYYLNRMTLKDYLELHEVLSEKIKKIFKELDRNKIEFERLKSFIISLFNELSGLDEESRKKILEIISHVNSLDILIVYMLTELGINHEKELKTVSMSKALLLLAQSNITKILFYIDKVIQEKLNAEKVNTIKKLLNQDIKQPIRISDEFLFRLSEITARKLIDYYLDKNLNEKEKTALVNIANNLKSLSNNDLKIDNMIWKNLMDEPRSESLTNKLIHNLYELWSKKGIIPSLISEKEKKIEYSFNYISITANFLYNLFLSEDKNIKNLIDYLINK